MRNQFDLEVEPYEIDSELDGEWDGFDTELADEEWEAGSWGGAAPRGSAAIAVPNLHILRNNIVRLANQEWMRWGRGTIKEWEPRIRGVLQDYWRIGTGRRYTTEPNWWSKHPWSAAFISWIMKRAGAGNAFMCAAALLMSSTR